MALALGMLLHAPVTQLAALLYYGLLGSFGDAAIIAVCVLWKRGGDIKALAGNHADVLVPAVVVAAVIYGALKIIWKGSRPTTQIEWHGPARPLLFPCRTTHTRLFPKIHSFAYSYLLVGIPVGWGGLAGGMISVENGEDRSRGWFTVDAADYLERGKGHLGLRGKLDGFLRSQGVDDSKYPYAYLTTAAKFMGYHFNPASFWYLYSAERQLTGMIIEVNNTFDERRMYYLTAEDDPQQNPACNGSASKPLRRTWLKDFHVSPFNSRKGGYSLVAHDPLASAMEGKGPINATINLTSSKGIPKLVARIFSQSEALDPAEMTFGQKAMFLLRWWWVGFVTFPRIVKEAALLFFRRKLHVWYRPEPLKESIGRHADTVECAFEPIFRDYLRHLVSQCSVPLAIRYIPCGISNAAAEEMSSTTASCNVGRAEHMELKILTPSFYTRFLYYAHDLEAFFCEMNESCTIWISEPKLLPKLVFKKPPPPLHMASYMDYAYFSAIKNLRQRPERIVRPLTSSQTLSTPPQKDIRGFRLSSIDGYVLTRENDTTRKLYRGLLLKLFVADRIAFGSLDILWVEGLVFRIILAWAALP